MPPQQRLENHEYSLYAVLRQYDNYNKLFTNI